VGPTEEPQQAGLVISLLWLSCAASGISPASWTVGQILLGLALFSVTYVAP